MTPDTIEKADRIEDALHTALPVFQESAVREAMEDPEVGREVAIRILRECLDAPSLDNFAPIYGLALAAYHRVVDAHPIILALAADPDDAGGELWGDHVTEGLFAALWSTSGGDLSGIWRLLESSQANPYCRWAAVTALWLAASEGAVSFEEVSRGVCDVYQRALDKDSRTASDDTLLAALAEELIDRDPDRAEPIVLRAAERGLTDPPVTPERVRSMAAEAREHPDRQREDVAGNEFPVDPIRLRDWDYFRDGDRLIAKERARAQQVRVAQQRAERQRKQRKKAQKKARKQSRR